MTSRRRLLLALGCGLVAPASSALAVDRARPAALRQPALKLAQPARAVLLSLARAGRVLVAVGERGLAIRSADDGKTWTQAAVPVSATLTTVRFANERDGWACGHLGIVLATHDGGLTWQRVHDGHADDETFLDLQRRRDGSLLAVGAAGLALTSADAGRSWQPLTDRLPNPDAFSFYGSVERAGGGEQFLFGEQGVLLRASGDGAWAAQASPTEATLFAGLALREGPLLLMGLRGKVWRSAAAGEAWTPVATPVDASLFAGHQMDDGRVLLVGAAGQLLLSSDSGRRFVPLNPPARFPFAALAAAADGSLVLAGMRGLLRVEPASLTAAKS